MFVYVSVLPYVLILALFVSLLTAAYRSHASARVLLLYPLVCSFALTIGFAAWGYYSIITSRSSTAAIGFLFLPVYALAVAVAGFLISWSVIFLEHLAVERQRGVPIRLARVFLAVLAVLMLCYAGLKTTKWVTRNRLLSTAASITTQPFDIKRMIDQAVLSHDLEVLALLARNPNSLVADLERIYKYCEFAVWKPNPPEYEVFYALARNPITPPEILIELAKSRQSTVRLAVGTNPNTPSQVLSELAEDKEQNVRYWLPSNPKILREVLVQLADDSDALVQRHARQYLGMQADAQP